MPFYPPSSPTTSFQAVLAPFLQDQGLPFADVLSAQDIQQACDAEGVCFGQAARSVFTPAVVLWAFLSQVLSKDKSCRAAVLRILVVLVALERGPCSLDTAAYCRARAKLPAALLRRLTLRAGQQLEAAVPRSWLWKGQHVLLADGTTCSLPDTPENQQAYPQSPAQKPGLGFPLIRMVVLLSLATAGLQGLAFGRYEGKETGETALFRTLVEQIPQGGIILADRYYCSYFLIALLQQSGVDVVFRIHQGRKYDFARGRRLGPDDHVVSWHKPQRPKWLDPEVYAALPATLTVREMRIQVRRPGYRVHELVVATTLCDASRYSKEEVMDLYHERWHVELVSVGKKQKHDQFLVFREYYLEDPRRRFDKDQESLAFSHLYVPSSRALAMRIAFEEQPTLDCPPPDKVPLNLQCRDEIVPILRCLQYIYSDDALRKTILNLVGKDVNRTTSKKLGRRGLSYWEITVLAGIRLGCNFDYDKLQDLAEQHRTLRLMMGIGSWQEDQQEDHQKRTKFDWRTIRDNLCWLRPETLQKINHAVVAAGHTLAPEAIKQVRGDSFVVETNIHYPTESNLINDGLRKVLKLSAELAREYGVPGWRQHEKLYKTVRQQVRVIHQAARSKSANKEKRVQKGYRVLLATANDLLCRATLLLGTVSMLTETPTELLARTAKQQAIKHYVALTRQVCETARRRVLAGETVSNAEKIFSIFEPHTELIKRNKEPNPIQFGHNVLVIEDAVGFVCHYEVMGQGVQDVDSVIPAMKELQKRSGGKIERASFDRGFHSPENQEELAKIVAHPCLAAKGAKQGRAQQEEESVIFRESRRRHPGVESAIGALQAGNGMERCRDRSKRGYERYVGLGIFGRNLHVLGKLLIAQEDSQCQAGKSKRKGVA